MVDSHARVNAHGAANSKRAAPEALLEAGSKAPTRSLVRLGTAFFRFARHGNPSAEPPSKCWYHRSNLAYLLGKRGPLTQATAARVSRACPLFFEFQAPGRLDQATSFRRVGSASLRNLRCPGLPGTANRLSPRRRRPRPPTNPMEVCRDSHRIKHRRPKCLIDSRAGDSPAALGIRRLWGWVSRRRLLGVSGEPGVRALARPRAD